MKGRISLALATVALAVAGLAGTASAAAPGPVYGEANCPGQYVAYLNGIVNGVDYYGNGFKGVADALGLSVKDAHDLIDAACGK